MFHVYYRDIRPKPYPTNAMGAKSNREKRDEVDRYGDIKLKYNKNQTEH